jgi:hypothetical protein
MGHQDSDLKLRLEYVETRVLQFAEEMAVCEDNAPRAFGIWRRDNKENLARSDELQERLRALMVDLVLAMERSPLITKGDIRDLARAGRRMCAALRFEKYTGSMLRRGEPIRTVEAQFILKDGFEAMGEWIALVLPETVADSPPATGDHPST